MLTPDLLCDWKTLCGQVNWCALYTVSLGKNIEEILKIKHDKWRWMKGEGKVS